MIIPSELTQKVLMAIISQPLPNNLFLGSMSASDINMPHISGSKHLHTYYLQDIQYTELHVYINLFHVYSKTLFR